MDDRLLGALARLVEDDVRDTPRAQGIADILWMARLLQPASRPHAPAARDSPPRTGPPGAPSAPGRIPPSAAGLPATPPAKSSPAAPPGDIELRPVPSGPAAPDAGPRGPAVTMRVPAMPAIPNALRLSRALRPLKRWVAKPGDTVLAEEATATAFGETELIMPVWGLAKERWLQVDLVVDTSTSMTIWRQTAAELHALLECHGAFRNVRAWAINADEPAPRLVPLSKTPAGQTVLPHSAAELVDPGGRRAILILTDAVGTGWHDGAMTPLLLAWARSCPLAIVQVLPRRLWHRTGLETHPVAGVMRPGARPPFRVLSSGISTAGGLPPGHPAAWVPVLYLDSDWLRPWATMAAGTAEKLTRMFAVPLHEEQAPPARQPVPDPDIPADERLRIFQEHTASAEALELAGYLAAAPLSVPVMRLVQHAMLPRSGPDHLAEVFLSGLLVRANPAAEAVDPDAVMYDFRAGVREKLLGGVTRRDSLRVLDVLQGVSGTIAKRFGGSLDFRAVASRATAGHDALPMESLPFARIAATVLEGLGGSYADLAQTLSEGSAGGPEAGQAAGDASPEAVADPALRAVPEEFRSAISRDLTRIDLSDRGLTAVPDWVRYFTGLTVLDLSGNRLTALPEWISELPALTSLDLRNSGLPTVPDSIRNLPRLTGLRLDPVATDRYDVFMSYGHGDAEWVETLAGNLERLGLRVFLDAWVLETGDLIGLRLQEGLTSAGAVVVVLSTDSVSRGWVNEELAAAVAAAAAGRQRLIPVLIDDAPIPVSVASRLYVDFRHTDSPAAYEAKVRDLAAAIRGRPVPSLREPGTGIVLPVAAYRAEGVLSARLTITADEVRFETAAQAASHRPTGLDARAKAVLDEAAIARQRPGGTSSAGAGTAGEGLHAALVAAGTTLGRCFLDGGAGPALAAEVAAATGSGAALRLAVDVPDPALAELPWETLVLPGQVTPLVLQQRVEVYRTARLERPPSAIQVRGPLRILAVIASPDTGGGEALDYEAELSAILSAVDPARRGKGAFVEVLNWGSLAAIRDALLERRYHVLHISCHARPGELILEDAAGNPDLVTAGRFAQALPADRGVPLVVLSTYGAPAGPGSVTTPEGIAWGLIRRGVPAVLTMTATVTDRYATAFAAEVYRQLATHEDPVPLTAVSDARRALEANRRALPYDDPWSAVAEWATPGLMQAGPPLALFHRADGLESLHPPDEPLLGPEIVARRVGEFVGRRAELRNLLAALRGSGAGVVVYGIGGVGKSTLAAQLVRQVGRDRGLVVAVSGTAPLSVDLVLEEFRRALIVFALAEGLDDRDPLRQVAGALADPAPPWRARLELIDRLVLPRLPVALLIDNAESLLTGDGGDRALADADLAAFLAAWVRAAPQAKLVVTSRYRFTLPGGAQRLLHWHQLGPLSLAETRKLIWRLPALDALSPAEQERAYAMVGGHPRTLEYLDALLRGGQAVFPDVAEQLETAIAGRGVTDPRQWQAGVEGDLDRALAETVTLAADDVLLDQLLASLADAPPAVELLRRLAVYRRPVDETGAAWQLSSLTTAPGLPATPAGHQQPVAEAPPRASRAESALEAEGPSPDPAVQAQYQQETPGLSVPPVSLSDDARRALELLTGLGLVTPATQDPGGDPGTAGLFVHRWTAAALASRTSPDELADAHRQAAAYWRWRVAARPHTQAEEIEQLLEARYHHHTAGDLAAALDANSQACDQLHTWGAWSTEGQLWDEALSWVPPRSTDAASVRLHLGRLARARGDYESAERLGQESLAISGELGDRAGLADSHLQLGVLAQARGDYRTAEERYQHALEIFMELSDRAGLARSTGQLGMLAQARGDYETAELRYQDALAVSEDLGDRAGVARTAGQLGMLAQARGDYETAGRRYQDSVAMFEELGDRAGLAESYRRLGMLAQAHGDYEEAEQRYRQSLAIYEELGDPSGLASSTGQLGMLAQARGDYETAEQRYQHALAIFEQLGDRASTAMLLSQLADLRSSQSRFPDAIRFQLQSLAIHSELGHATGVAADVRALFQQRAAVGEEEFLNVLRTVLGTDLTADIMQLTEQASATASDEALRALRTALSTDTTFATPRGANEPGAAGSARQGSTIRPPRG